MNSFRKYTFARSAVASSRLDQSSTPAVYFDEIPKLNDGIMDAMHELALLCARTSRFQLASPAFRPIPRTAWEWNFPWGRFSFLQFFEVIALGFNRRLLSLSSPAAPFFLSISNFSFLLGIGRLTQSPSACAQALFFRITRLPLSFLYHSLFWNRTFSCRWQVTPGSYSEFRPLIHVTSPYDATTIGL